MYLAPECVFHACRNAKSYTAVDTALTSVVMLIVSVEDVDFVSQKSSHLIASMDDKYLFITEF